MIQSVFKQKCKHLELDGVEALLIDKKAIVVIVAVLLIGLSTGYIFSYISFQPQIQNLKNELSSLENEMNSQFADSQAELEDLADTISDLSDIINELNVTSETPGDNDTTPTIERLDILNVDATGNGTHFEIDFTLKNSGTGSLTLIIIYLNGYPTQVLPDVALVELNGTSYEPQAFFGLSIPVEGIGEGKITLIAGIGEALNFQPGSQIEIWFETSQRYRYPTGVILPA